MGHPKGCILTGGNAVTGRCDVVACNHPFCEDSGVSASSSEVEMTLLLDNDNPPITKTSRRRRADMIKNFRCRHLVAVLENPSNIMNVASVIRNVNALGVDRVYVVDPGHNFPDDWQELRQREKLSKLSVSASRWTFVKRFDTTDECFDHLEAHGYQSIATSSHVKGKECYYLDEGDYTKMPKLAVWFGNEGRGISDRAVERSKACVSVPMFGMVDSLNLGTCSGIVLYEVTKQRRAYQSQYRRRNKRGKRAEPLPTVLRARDKEVV